VPRFQPERRFDVAVAFVVVVFVVVVVRILKVVNFPREILSAESVHYNRVNMEFKYFRYLNPNSKYIHSTINFVNSICNANSYNIHV
jgi:hypothetical protein